MEAIDIEAAFLEADLDEDVFIEWPEGLVEFGYMTKEEQDGMCIQLGKAMYGCVQSPLAFFNELSKQLRKMGLKQCKADPCIWYRMDGDRLVLIVAVYVDDCILAGKKKDIEIFKVNIQGRFKISDLGEIKKHLGIWYEKCKDDDGVYYELSMKKYVDDICIDWKGLTGKDPKLAATPGYPGESLVKNEGEAVNKGAYQVMLGKLMWFSRKVIPECANPVRELAMFMDNPGDDHWKAMSRMIGYISEKEPIVKLRKPWNLKVVAFVDSNFATNKETRRSVAGYVVTVGGCLINHLSKLIPAMTLSSTESEYYVASMCATEIKFIQMLFEELLPTEVTRPATLLKITQEQST